MTDEQIKKARRAAEESLDVDGMEGRLARWLLVALDALGTARENYEAQYEIARNEAERRCDLRDALAACTDARDTACASLDRCRDVLRRVLAERVVAVFEDDSTTGEIVPVIDAISADLCTEAEKEVGDG